MKDLVEVIAKSLVDHPEEVVVTQTEESNAILVELKVAPSDMGKVIGRQGRIAKAIRTVVKAASSKLLSHKNCCEYSTGHPAVSGFSYLKENGILPGTF